MHIKEARARVSMYFIICVCVVRSVCHLNLYIYNICINIYCCSSTPYDKSKNNYHIIPILIFRSYICTRHCVSKRMKKLQSTLTHDQPNDSYNRIGNKPVIGYSKIKSSTHIHTFSTFNKAKQKIVL